MSHPRQHRLLAALAVAAVLEAACAVPAVATGQVEAVSDCARHCKKVRSAAAASQCCGVDTAAKDPARLPAPGAPEHMVLVPVAVLPALPVLALAARGPTAAGQTLAFATGPPRFLRLQTFLL